LQLGFIYAVHCSSLTFSSALTRKFLELIFLVMLSAQLVALFALV
jgi:hypothetical protein